MRGKGSGLPLGLKQRGIAGAMKLDSKQSRGRGTPFAETGASVEPGVLPQVLPAGGNLAITEQLAKGLRERRGQW